MEHKRIFALGFFDGVHLGHQALLVQCCRMAQEQGFESAAITFDRHPQALISNNPPVLISTLPDRLLLLKAFGIEHIKVLPVTEAMMTTPWQRFLQLLMEEGAAGFVCGEDFRFGYRGQGNAQLLREFCEARGLPCSVIPQQSLSDTRISSTYIRRQIEEGDMATAVRFLGHPVTLTGSVVRGQQLGRTLGIPTANLRLPQGVVEPKHGVYACMCLIDEKRYCAVTNVGTRPTVAGQGITVEPWILDYSGDLYGREITLEFYRFLRGEQKFSDLEDLKRQVHRDARETRGYLRKP